MSDRGDVNRTPMDSLAEYRHRDRRDATKSIAMPRSVAGENGLR
jgi:hypothetical protein